MTTEIARNQRRDKKGNKKFAPQVGGLPKGFPLGYWMKKQKAKGMK